MKKIFTPAFILFFSSVTFAQITIQQSDFPVAGNYLVELRDTLKGVHTITPASATAQVWNYTNAFTVVDTTTTLFKVRSAVPYASFFTNATLGSYDSVADQSIFYKSLSTGFWVDGVYDNAQTDPNLKKIDPNPDLLVAPTPFTYGNSKTNNSRVVIDIPGSPNIRYIVTIKQTITCDAWGTLTTPSDTNASVIRNKNFSYRIDSTFVNVFGSVYTFLSTTGPTDTAITYSFLRKGPNAFVMNINQDHVTLQSTGASYYVYSPIVLPVSLLTFKAHYAGNNKVNLFWSTSSQRNNAMFTIERSSDGQNFIRVLDVTGRENSNSLINYTATDNVSSKGILYYRLKQTDLDGKYFYSDVVTVNADERSLLLTVSPNPALNNINISFDSPVTGTALLSIYSYNGALISKMQIPAGIGNNKILYDIASLPKGLYYVVINAANKTYQQNFIKQ